MPAYHQGSSIVVHVLDDLEDPIAGARVLVQRFGFVGGQRGLTAATADSSTSETDDRGVASLSG